MWPFNYWLQDESYRLNRVEREVAYMSMELDALKKAESELEEVVAAVVESHKALVEKLNGAMANSDWTGVSQVVSEIHGSIDQLKSILPAKPESVTEGDPV